MLSIAICDDDKVFCKEINNIIEEYNEFYKTKVFYEGDKLLSFMSEGNEFDIIFLDIEMSKLNGIDVGKIIREKMKNYTTQIVYISSKESYAINLFKIRTFDFLIKPIKAKDIINTINSALQLKAVTCGFFEFTIEGNLIKILLNEILYFESNLRKVKIVTISGEYYTYKKLYQIIEEVNKSNFVLVHQSYLINFNLVKSYSYEKVIMMNDHAISISQQNRKQVRTYFLNQRSNHHG